VNAQQLILLHSNGRCGKQVLIVTDPLALSAAASLDVGVGHYSDPGGFVGLAHFCEHMLFMGTASFPEENSFRAFLSLNGGSSNAYTGAENTAYYFEQVVKTSSNAQETTSTLGPEGALARFATFFKEPLFTSSASEREVNAVDSEHRNNLQADSWRLSQLHKAIHANPAHPLSGFSTGSKDTLLPLGQAISGQGGMYTESLYM
jgi:insulysin